MVSLPQSPRWQFWIDRGGTFTDIVAQRPDGSIAVHKLLSENPDRYQDAPIQGIRELMGLAPEDAIPADDIAVIKMGTTVATNALLERKGDRTLFVTTQGFGDGLRIGYQNRPEIFARQIVLPELLYERVIEVAERMSAQGEVLKPLDAAVESEFLTELQAAYAEGMRSCAIALLHGYRYPDHELRLAELARQVGFTQVSASHQVSPLMKWVGRADTTVVDAYLSPILHRYVERIHQGLSSERSSCPSPLSLGRGGIEAPVLLFMQSNGGLVDAQQFQGKDSILSGPAGGIVGAVQTSQRAGFDKIITFDMGGTSTDVAHFAGDYERAFDTEVAGVRVRAPMLAIHTVAAGGGSILQFDGSRYRVGPESAGAHPGPTCYRQGGPLTVTDCNVMVGKIQPQFFPQVFGPDGNLAIDRDTVVAQFTALAATIAQTTGQQPRPEAIAAGFLAIAIDNMANAIRKISVQRGYDLSDYTLCCFGAAGGQHACRLADALGMSTILIHPYAGVLSAYGMGLAARRLLREQAVETELNVETLQALQPQQQAIAQQICADLAQQTTTETLTITTITKLHLRYAGTDTALLIDWPLSVLIEVPQGEGNDRHSSVLSCQETLVKIQSQFEQVYRQRFGFLLPNKALIIEAFSVEAIGQTAHPEPPALSRDRSGETLDEPTPIAVVPVFTGVGSGEWGVESGEWLETPVFQRSQLQPGDRISGPAIILEPTGTNMIEPGWFATVSIIGDLILQRVPLTPSPSSSERGRQDTSPSLLPPPYSPTPPSQFSPDPVRLEIFNNRFQAIAEQMGFTLQNTSSSVNIKERLDFSCAIFDSRGELVANAPHIPVHLGSMGDSVKALLTAHGVDLKSGDVYISNNPYNGGTHLPDITVITPVFLTNISEKEGDPQPRLPTFFVASRGHHADIGGITPGSMPPLSTHIAEEGILFDNLPLVQAGELQEITLRSLLTNAPYPARNPDQNLADLRAQIAANAKGAQELQALGQQYGIETVQAYMHHVQTNAEQAVRQVITTLALTLGDRPSSFTVPLDNGAQIQVTVTLNPSQQTAYIDFSGTSAQQPNNFNAPAAIAKAVVLYVFRTLVSDAIPLNAGCLKPLSIHLPEGSLLNPCYPAAVVAGNVETSQAIADALYAALGVMAASQGTMNNFTFGNAQYQYYETIAGGSGAGSGFAGASGVQTHMTNSRLTDPEVLEWRFPVLVEAFALRHGSGGRGAYPGGDGVVRRLRFREPLTVGLLAGRRRQVPFGLAGGTAGQAGRNWLIRASDPTATPQVLPGVIELALETGDTLVIETPGGGGFGD